jgi:DNA-binding transcriptional ArsR family regulator
MIDEDEVRRHYTTLRPSLDERGRRLFAASQVRALGYGGIAAVARATGIAPSTIGRGLKELDQVGGIAAPAAERVRRPGGGRKRLSDTDATLVHNLLRLVEPATLGDPMRALLWVSKSTEKLSAALRALGHRVSANTVLRLLRTLGFSRQGNFKANEGRHHPDRDAQFEHINATVLAFQAAEQPVISVNTKKKELIGNYKNAGTELRPQGQPRRVNGHDFADKELGKAIPYGVYDVTDNSGWVSSASPTTPLSSPSMPSGCGWKRWAARAIPTPSG